MTLTLSSVTGSTYQYWPSDPCQLCSLISVSAITLFFKAFWSIINSKVVMTRSQNTPLPSLKDGLMVSIRKTFISINAFFSISSVWLSHFVWTFNLPWILNPEFMSFGLIRRLQWRLGASSITMQSNSNPFPPSPCTPSCDQRVLTIYLSIRIQKKGKR